jgi:hypothetical protein
VLGVIIAVSVLSGVFVPLSSLLSSIGSQDIRQKEHMHKANIIDNITFFILTS